MEWSDDVEVAADAGALLGEGPCWDAKEGVLWWVDITGGIVHRYDPCTGADATLVVGQPVGMVAKRASGGLVIAVRDGFAALEPSTGRVEMLLDVERDKPFTRFNDGKVDSQGRLWAGTMGSGGQRGSGTLYRLDSKVGATPILKAVTVSNGLGWSPDDRTMYYIDSATNRIDAFDYNPAAGTVSGRRTLVRVDNEDGVPDGMTVDADGHLWVAIAYGACIRRYAPDGTLVAAVETPTPIPTSCTFGGADLADLYVTSMSEGIPEEEARSTHAGALFRYRPGVTGLPTHAYAG